MKNNTRLQTVADLLVPQLLSTRRACAPYSRAHAAATLPGQSKIRIELYIASRVDGECNGKPVRITETWASDDLAATILEILSDPRKQMEDITTLTNIKREEPAHSLFEIPPGDKIDPTPDEMPFQMGGGVPVATNPEK